MSGQVVTTVHPEQGLRRILVIDDHRLVAEALKAALEVDGYQVVVSACVTAAAIVDEARDARPTLVLLDLDLAGAGTGLDLVAPLVELGATVLLLTGTLDQVELARCLEAGAVGVASKSEASGVVLEKIRRAANGDPVTSVGDRSRYMDGLAEHRRRHGPTAAGLASLTARERQVLARMVDGVPATAIAREFFVALPTVRSQIRSILQKLGVNSQMAAVAKARTAGWPPATR
ncbi:MAG: response regulator [Acidimicrobiales bacterium]